MPAGPIALHCGELSISIDLAHGARAVSLRCDGEELLGGNSADPVEHGMYPMGPWAGRLLGNEVHADEQSWPMPVNYGPWALHGTVLDRPWEVVGLMQESDHAWLAARTELGEHWPWRGSMELTWSLHRSILRTSLILRAHGSEFPAVIGMHPWLRKTTRFGEAQWQARGAVMAERRPDFSLTGELVTDPPIHGTLDDAFLVPDARAQVSWGHGLSLEIHQSHQWFVVYDAHPQLLCIEPQTGPTDGLHDGAFGSPVLVSPGKPLTQHTAWTFRRG